MRKLLCCLITVFVTSGIATAQTVMKKIAGSVTDSQGQPIPGASVTSTDGSYGTITDTDGNFSLEVPEKTVLLSGGRLGDIGRHEAVDKTIRDAEEAALAAGAVHGEILIEDAVKDAGVIIAPDGISGNLIFRTLVFLGGGIGHGALIVNIPDLFVDSSRASAGYAGILAMTKRLMQDKIR